MFSIRRAVVVGGALFFVQGLESASAQIDPDPCLGGAEWCFGAWSTPVNLTALESPAFLTAFCPGATPYNWVNCNGNPPLPPPAPPIRCEEIAHANLVSSGPKEGWILFWRGYLPDADTDPAEETYLWQPDGAVVRKMCVRDVEGLVTANRTSTDRSSAAGTPTSATAGCSSRARASSIVAAPRMRSRRPGRLGCSAPASSPILLRRSRPAGELDSASRTCTETGGTQAHLPGPMEASWSRGERTSLAS